MLAERGRSFRPRLVKGFRDVDGNIKSTPPVEDKPVTGISDADWTTVIVRMVHTTHCDTYCGTGWVAFKGAAYDAAGKTGTAQVYTVAQNAKYNAKAVPETLRDHAWFIAFAPAEDPKIAVAVLVENGGFGASDAAPIARKVMDAYLLHQTPNEAESATPQATPSQGNPLVESVDIGHGGIARTRRTLSRLGETAVGAEPRRPAAGGAGSVSRSTVWRSSTAPRARASTR